MGSIRRFARLLADSEQREREAAKASEPLHEVIPLPLPESLHCGGKPPESNELLD